MAGTGYIFKISKTSHVHVCWDQNYAPTCLDSALLLMSPLPSPDKSPLLCQLCNVLNQSWRNTQILCESSPKSPEVFCLRLYLYKNSHMTLWEKLCLILCQYACLYITPKTHVSHLHPNRSWLPFFLDKCHPKCQQFKLPQCQIVNTFSQVPFYIKWGPLTHAITLFVFYRNVHLTSIIVLITLYSNQLSDVIGPT